LLRNTKQNKSYAYSKPKNDSKEAILHYRVLNQSDKYYLLEIELKTGRHHQIRAQLAAIGCIIKGDMKYGSPRSNPGGGIHLHARKIEFVHPVSKKEISITAPVPDDNLWTFFEKQENKKVL
jgi:23S rRNA pseudouridine1911/1915/1917 synthase